MKAKQKLLQTATPFLEELIRYAGLHQIGFHTPGHRGGRSLGAIWNNLDLASLDLTEISGLAWEQALEEAQRLAAEFYKADCSFFLVQGATQGICGAILGCFHPGDTVLVARNCHVSVLHAVILAGLNPVFVKTDWLAEWGIPLGLNQEALQEAVLACPQYKGLILTNPSYQGLAARVNWFREIVGERLLIIDEAHGGHFEWCGIPGRDAYETADIWVHGTHKFLGAPTQTGMLHLNTTKVRPEEIRKGLDLITTTSPSFVLRAALDANRQFLATEGYRLFTANRDLVVRLREELNTINGLRLLDVATIPDTGLEQDPWKLTFSCAGMGLTGYETERILQSEYQIQVEYADPVQVTCFLSPWQDQSDLQRLGQALRSVSRSKHGAAVAPLSKTVLPAIPPLVNNPRDALYAPARELSLEQAVGRVAATVVAPYPPGIPVIVPGELIQEDAVDFIERILALGGRVNGVNPDGNLIRCVA